MHEIRQSLIISKLSEKEFHLEVGGYLHCTVRNT
jgi:hypothetical protein